MKPAAPLVFVGMLCGAAVYTFPDPVFKGFMFLAALLLTATAVRFWGWP